MLETSDYLSSEIKKSNPVKLLSVKSQGLSSDLSSPCGGQPGKNGTKIKG